MDNEQVVSPQCVVGTETRSILRSRMPSTTQKRKITNEQKDRIMDEIRCSRDEPTAPLWLYPDEDKFDLWIESAREQWAKARNAPVEVVRVICALALVGNA